MLLVHHQADSCPQAPFPNIERVVKPFYQSSVPKLDVISVSGGDARLKTKQNSCQDGFHGFKGMQITTSALAAEAAKLSMPASVFSRSTELHNQDKVSMGSIAARDCLRILELTETVAAIACLALVQALELRGDAISGRAGSLVAAVRSEVPPLLEDRRQDHDIAKVVRLLHAGALTQPDEGAWTP